MVRKSLCTLIKSIGGLGKAILYLCTALSCSLFLVGAYAPLIPPIRATLPAILGLCFPILLLLQILITGLWLLRWHKWRILLLLALVWGLCWHSVSLYLPMRSETSEHKLPKDGLKVLSYNVAGFGFLPHRESRPNPILQYIKSSGADIVCLQEAALVLPKLRGVSQKSLKQFLSHDYPYIHAEQVQAGGSTLMLLSKYPILSSERLPISSRANGAMLYRVQTPRGELVVLNLHLESFHLTQRDGIHYIEMVQERDTREISNVMHNRLAPVFRQHNLQANLIHSLLEHLGREHVIVCGDFNDTPISYTHHKICEGLKDAFGTSGRGFGFSFERGIFIVRIDHILFGSAFEKATTTTVDNNISYSDHYPISTQLEWRD